MKGYLLVLPVFWGIITDLDLGVEYAWTNCARQTIRRGDETNVVEIRTNEPPNTNELAAFFEGWLVPPTTATRAELMIGSDVVVTARDQGRLVGFCTAITDGCMHAMITLLEVSPGYRGQGTGSALMRAALDCLERVMDVVVTTDPEISPFYGALGFEEAFALRRRDRSYQDGN